MNRSKTNVPIKIFRFPNASKNLKIKHDKNQPTLNSSCVFLSAKQKNSSQKFSSPSLISQKNLHCLSFSQSNLTMGNFFDHSLKKPLITITAAKKPESNELFSNTTENFTNYFSKKKKILLKKMPKFKKVYKSIDDYSVKCDLNQSFKVIKQNFNALHKIKDPHIKTKPKRKIHAWIPQTRSFENLV